MNEPSIMDLRYRYWRSVSGDTRIGVSIQSIKYKYFKELLNL